MVNIKKILELCVENKICDTLGQLYGRYLIDDLAYAHSEGPIFEKSKEAFEELKRLMLIWEEKYGFNMDTKIVDILKKI